jgi:hypothetical protein
VAQLYMNASRARSGKMGAYLTPPR